MRIRQVNSVCPVPFAASSQPRDAWAASQIDSSTATSQPDRPSSPHNRGAATSRTNGNQQRPNPADDGA
ncbi:hypothetical protein [Micromonospora tarensis]|uniref:hypothetical protein n=1 Tax=Micromonospora tarensis TaxID=2806100 RepID=UPI001EE4B5C1|nr:hypothetical protein [Micromonospora tarensis]